MLSTCLYVKKKDDSPYSGHDVETWPHKIVTYRALRNFISIVLLMVVAGTVNLLDLCKWIVLDDVKTSFNFLKYTPVVASDYRTCLTQHTKSFVTRNISVATNIQTR